MIYLIYTIINIVRTILVLFKLLKNILRLSKGYLMIF